MPPATGPSPADELARMVEQLNASEGQPAAPPGLAAGAGTKDLVLVDAPRTGGGTGSSSWTTRARGVR